MRFLMGRHFSGGSVLDIGAHRGEYSFWMHQHFAEGTRVVAFEPQPELAEFLGEFKESFHLERLDVAPVGLSSHSGSLPMHRQRDSWEAASFDVYCDENETTEVLDVPVTTIDEYLDEHPELRPVRFIKCDVEYHEADVLDGARRTLREDRPEILVEWSTPRRSYRERMFSMAQELGYAIFQFEYGKLVPCTSVERRSPPSWELGGNYLLLPSGRPDGASDCARFTSSEVVATLGERHAEGCLGPFDDAGVKHF
jgi:FkbM family methyltransferase